MEPQARAAVGPCGEGRPMKPSSDYSTIEALAAVIAHSQIVVAQPQRPMPSLPAGFDDSDIAVLDAPRAGVSAAASCRCSPG
jgi:hypothetical protein